MKSFLQAPFHSLIYHVLTPAIWKVSPKKKVETVQLFASVELDSCWQLLNAIPHYNDPHTQAQLFLNACEEIGHGQWFEDESLRMSEKRPPISMPGRMPLIPEKPTTTDLQRFLLFFHIGESEVCQKFHTLSKTNIDPGVREIFRKISEEEIQHGSGCLELIERQGPIPEMGKMKFGITWEKRKNDILRIASNLHLPLTIVLNVIYFSFGLFIYRRMRERFLLDRNEQLGIFKTQTAKFQEQLKKL